MKILTHITISIILFKHFKKNMNLNKAYFIYGNIKPDLHYKLIKKAHIMENHFGDVCNSANELIQKVKSDKSFSQQLGQICHYVCDFFCKYHSNNEVFHKLGGHFLHEHRLQFLLWKLMWKKQLNLISRTERRNIGSILLEMRSNYIAEADALEKDLIYAISTALWIGESVAYYLPQPAELALPNIMEMPSRVPMVAGK